MDHGNQIFTEQKLTVGVIFRCDDTDALVIVDREQNFLRQLSGQERADDLAAIHADDGVDRLFVDVMVCERKRSVVRQTVFVLQPCDVKVMTVMGMPGCKMTMECNEFEIRILSGTDGLCTHRQYLLAYSRRNGGGCRRGKAAFIWFSCGGYIIIDTES